MGKSFKCFMMAIIVLCSNINFAYGSNVEWGNPVATYSGEGIYLSNGDMVEINEYKTLLFLNGTLITDYETIVRDDMAYVPLRFIAEEFDASVGWDKSDRKVTIKWQQQEIVLTINSEIILENGRENSLVNPVIIYKDLAYVPASFPGQCFGGTVQYFYGAYPKNTIVGNFANLIIDKGYDFSYSVTPEEAMKKTKEVCLEGLENFAQSLEENLAKDGQDSKHLHSSFERIETEINEMVYIGELSRYFKFTMGPYDVLFDRMNEKMFFVIHSSSTIIKEIDVNDPSLYTYVFIAG